MIVVFGALLCALIGTLNAFQQQACLGANFNQFIISPSPVGCHQYVGCFRGQAQIGHCDPGRHFNVRNQRCSPAGTVDCTQCGTNGNVNLPHPTLCQRYFECIFGFRAERVCPNGLLFDRLAGSCNRAHLVNCGEMQPNPPPGPPQPPPPGNGQWPVCVPGGQVHHGHPTDCTMFFQCINGILHQRVCSPGHHWSERKMACDTIENARCFR